tara:strand:- start:370 stop:723 length:354 start_codon:yes stop_codon:yes gene_type:complete
MSIFLSNRAKENAKGYWYGLLFPIVVGWGTSFLSMFMVIRFEESIVRDSFVDYVLMSIYGLGFLVIWPLFAHRLFSRAQKLGKEPLRNGSRTSIILYVFFLLLVVLPLTIVSVMEAM